MLNRTFFFHLPHKLLFLSKFYHWNKVCGKIIFVVLSIATSWNCTWLPKWWRNAWKNQCTRVNWVIRSWYFTQYVLVFMEYMVGTREHRLYCALYGALFCVLYGFIQGSILFSKLICPTLYSLVKESLLHFWECLLHSLSYVYTWNCVN